MLIIHPFLPTIPKILCEKNFSPLISLQMIEKTMPPTITPSPINFAHSRPSTQSTKLNNNYSKSNSPQISHRTNYSSTIKTPRTITPKCDLPDFGLPATSNNNNSIIRPISRPKSRSFRTNNSRPGTSRSLMSSGMLSGSVNSKNKHPLFYINKGGLPLSDEY